ncbi:MAG: VOC family protein [Actinomycetota bacterium]|nr:VOC family protein [Actinomycetota bacterium]
MAPNSRLNHVAMSVPAHLLDEATRANIVAFYGEVFGWSEQALDEPGNPLVIRVSVEPTQFVFVQPDPGDATRPGHMDHFGVEVSSEEAVDEILTAARQFQQKDSRVEIVDKQVVRTPSAESAFDYETINCYVRYILPLMVEVQHFRQAPKS